jgi:hypothetical protein
MLVKTVLSDPTKVAQLATDPRGVLTQAADSAKEETPVYFTDRWIYRLVVGFLGSTAILVVLSYAIYPIAKIVTIPEGLVAMGSAALGALAGLLAPSPGKQS